MPLVIHPCDQNTETWARARMGMPTASMFSVIGRQKGRAADGTSKTRTTYLYKLAGEILTGEPMESYSNADTDRGHLQEPDARNLYAFQQDVEPELVGFIEDTDLRAGASPDALVGSDGLVEIKSCLPHIQIDRLIKGALPPEHVPQVQGGLLISGRGWADFVSYSPKLPLLVVRVERDQSYITNLWADIRRFNDELDALVERIRRYGMSPLDVVREQLTKSLADEPVNILSAG